MKPHHNDSLQSPPVHKTSLKQSSTHGVELNVRIDIQAIGFGSNGGRHGGQNRRPGQRGKAIASRLNLAAFGAAFCVARRIA